MCSVLIGPLLTAWESMEGSVNCSIAPRPACLTHGLQIGWRTWGSQEQWRAASPCDSCSRSAVVLLHCKPRFSSSLFIYFLVKCNCKEKRVKLYRNLYRCLVGGARAYIKFEFRILFNMMTLEVLYAMKMVKCWLISMYLAQFCIIVLSKEAFRKGSFMFQVSGFCPLTVVNSSRAVHFSRPMAFHIKPLHVAWKTPI